MAEHELNRTHASAFRGCHVGPDPQSRPRIAVQPVPGQASRGSTVRTRATKPLNSVM